MQQAVIKLENIVKTYKMGDMEQVVLRGVSIEIEKGELVAIMGSSGSGKSTIMNIIGCLDRPSKGNYYLDGKEVSTLSDDELATTRNRKLAFVFQQFYLLPRLTAEQNVALPLKYRDTDEKEIKQRVTVMLAKVGMAERAHHRPSELSGGQQQRVAIARALVSEPEVILADEPTGALDSVTTTEVMQLFLELNEKDGKTIVIVTHDPKIGEQCKRIIRVSDGRIVE